MGILSSLAQWFVATIGSAGYLGIFILMALESSIIPVPSELVLIPAGYLVFKNQMSFILLFIISIFGSIFGSLASYCIAYFLGRKPINKFVEKYGKALLLNKEKLDKTDNYFEKHGHITIFTARFIPVIRHLISLPAGFSKMNLIEFISYTALGAGIWNFILIWMGYLFGQNQALIQQNLKLFTIAAILFCGIIIFIYVIIKKLKKKKIN